MRRFVLSGIYRRLSAHIFVIVPVLALFTGLGHAQFTNANLGGTVTDPSGAPVAEAAITVTNTDTGLQRSTTSDGSGEYLFTALPVGHYQITVEKAGFSR